MADFVVGPLLYSTISDSEVCVVGVNGRHIENIVIPSHVEYEEKSYKVASINSSAFFGCARLTSIVISNSVISITSSAFEGCCHIEVIIVDKNNPKYCSLGNCLIEKKKKLLVLGCKNSVIPYGITTICWQAFDGCMDLSSIVIPDSVTTIGGSAFRGCIKLSSIVIPDSVTTIGDSAFEGCCRLKSIVIPSSITSIGISAFGYLKLESLVSLVTNEDVFYEIFYPLDSLSNEFSDGWCMEALESTSVDVVYVPDEKVEQYKSSDYWCRFNIQPISKKLVGIVEQDNLSKIQEEFTINGLRYIVVDAQNCFVSVGRGISYDGDIVIPSVVEYNGVAYSVKSIEENAFAFSVALHSVVIPNSVTSIGSKAFFWCGELQSVTIPGTIVFIGEGAFDGCLKLKNIGCSE